MFDVGRWKITRILITMKAIVRDKCHNKGLLKERDRLHGRENNCKAVDELIDIIFYYECI